MDGMTRIEEIEELLKLVGKSSPYRKHVTYLLSERKKYRDALEEMVKGKERCAVCVDSSCTHGCRTSVGIAQAALKEG